MPFDGGNYTAGFMIHWMRLMFWTRVQKWQYSVLIHIYNRKYGENIIYNEVLVIWVIIHKRNNIFIKIKFSFTIQWGKGISNLLTVLLLS